MGECEHFASVWMEENSYTLQEIVFVNLVFNGFLGNLIENLFFDISWLDASIVREVLDFYGRGQIKVFGCNSGRDSVRADAI